MPQRQQLLHIIQGCVNTNRECQKELYKLYYNFCISICVRYCHNPDDALEVTNDGFLKVFKTIGKFSPKYDNFEASLISWIKSIMIYAAIDNFRKNNRYNHQLDIEEVHYNIKDNDESSIDRMSYKEIVEMVQKLSPVYRTVFNLYVIDGYKHEEIATQLNITVGTSKSNLAKARINIQKLLKATNVKLYEQRRAI